jgi:hypothetical protein
MEENKNENGWLGAIKVAAIIIALLFTAMIAWWIYLVGSETYSRAENENADSHMRNVLIFHSDQRGANASSETRFYEIGFNLIS